MTRSPILTSPLALHIQQSLVDHQGWMGFDEFMAQALYTPGLGYYAHDSLKFGALPYTVQDGERVAGSDFVTAPELSALFGRTVAAKWRRPCRSPAPKRCGNLEPVRAHWPCRCSTR